MIDINKLRDRTKEAIDREQRQFEAMLVRVQKRAEEEITAAADRGKYAYVLQFENSKWKEPTSERIFDWLKQQHFDVELNQFDHSITVKWLPNE